MSSVKDISGCTSWTVSGHYFDRCCSDSSLILTVTTGSSCYVILLQHDSVSLSLICRNSDP